MAPEDIAFGVPEHCRVGLGKTHKLNSEGSAASKGWPPVDSDTFLLGASGNTDPPPCSLTGDAKI